MIVDGATATPIAIDVDRAALPPAPVHVNVYVPEVVSAFSVELPDIAFAPDHAPEAVHELASVLNHVSVDEPLAGTELGLALIVTVGTSVVPLTVTVAD